MISNNDGLGSYMHGLANAGRAINSSSFSKNFRNTDSVRYIRFVDKHEKFVWLLPDDIFFVKSTDRYVKALIRYGNQLRCMKRYCTLKELLSLLPAGKFIRLNSCYLLNLHSLSYFKKKQKPVFYKNDSVIEVPHRISPFLQQMLHINYM